MKMPHDTIVMAVDGQKMLIFRNEGDERYPVLQVCRHEETNAPAARDLGADRPGRSFASLDRRRSAYAETDWHRQAEERFATHAAAQLAQAAQGNDAALVILAPPRFLGWLRASLPRSLKPRILGEIDKDVVHQETEDIIATIGAHDGIGAH